jgi:hypothetical protein
MPGKRRASSLTSHDNQGTSAFKHRRAYDRFQCGSLGGHGVPELGAGEVDEATPWPKDAPSHRPGPWKGSEGPGEARVHLSTHVLGAPHHHARVRQPQFLDGELEEGGSLGPALYEQDSDSWLRDGDDDPRQPSSRPEIAHDIVPVYQRRGPEAVEDVPIPDPSSVRPGDGAERYGSPSQQILVPQEGCGPGGIERDGELRGLPQQDLRFAHRCFT